MPDYAIGAVNAATPSFYTDSLQGTAADTAVYSTGGLDFGSVLGAAGTGLGGTSPASSVAGTGSVAGVVETLQGLQSTSNDLAVKAVTGDLTDVHDYTIAATEAATALELTAAVRNKAVEAFSEIMRMQA